MGVFERYLTVWVLLCIVAGIALGKIAPGAATFLDGLAIYVNEAPVVSIPIALCLFFMMYPIMVKIDFAEVVRAGKTVKPVSLTLFANWAVKPFTMYAIALFFLGTLFLRFIGPEATDLVKMPFGLDLPLGAGYGAGRVIEVEGVKMLEVPLWRSYHSPRDRSLYRHGPGLGLPGPGQRWPHPGDGGHQLAHDAGALRRPGWLPARGGTPPGALAGAPALDRDLRRPPAGRRVLLAKVDHRQEGRNVVQGALPLTILWIAIPLFLQTMLIFWLTYGAARLLNLSYADAAPSAMIGASNHFEVAIATATVLFGLSSGAALATVVGVLIEVPVMLMLVRICLGTPHWFRR
jgi:ACR3 family arsenite transporter